MKYTISENECRKNDLNIEEVLAILLIKKGVNIPRLFKDLEDKSIIVKDDIFDNYLVTQRWDDVVSTILLNSDKDKPKESRIDKLTACLMDIFPKQKKVGTCHYFRGNKKDISLRLKKFFKLYGDKYTDEEILNAARQYVASFNGNYNYMRILKYFIWKDEKKMNPDGDYYIEETSDLASCIENSGQESSTNTEWTATLR